jgi:cation diffusion facilitator CzcD-associated flavoprotein CzcO
MRRHLITLLAVITLLSQWGWLEHGYHQHDPDEVCEVCVSASGHVGLTPSAPQLPDFAGVDFFTPAATASHLATAPRFYATRAPPRFL